SLTRRLLVTPCARRATPRISGIGTSLAPRWRSLGGCAPEPSDGACPDLAKCRYRSTAATTMIVRYRQDRIGKTQVGDMQTIQSIVGIFGLLAITVAISED